MLCFEIFDKEKLFLRISKKKLVTLQFDERQSFARKIFFRL